MKTRYTFTFIFFLFTLTVTAQRKLPYPIILIHGFGGSSSTWIRFKSYLNSQLGLSIEPNDLRFCLNSDGNAYYSSKYTDVYRYPVSIGNNDIYTINFDECQGSRLSNQSGIVKQGYAIGMAIQSILNATGAKKVILFGHSMGGLAAREYLQNAENWPSSHHQVAKLVTLGTPHLGSNLGSGDLNLGLILKGLDESSESVRDLRTSYKSDY